MRDLMKEMKYRKLDYDKLSLYGFSFENGIYSYEKNIFEDTYRVVFEIKDSKISSKLIENAFQEEYLLVDVENARGEYVGKVREAYQKEIDDFIEHCTVVSIFKAKQTYQLISYVEKKYNDHLEHLWEKFPDNAIWRNQKNQKWYGLIMTISESKLGNFPDRKIEVLDILYPKEEVENIVDHKMFFPGYHMNKKSWITIKLDGSVPFKKICELLDQSYEISLKK